MSPRTSGDPVVGLMYLLFLSEAFPAPAVLPEADPRWWLMWDERLDLLPGLRAAREALGMALSAWHHLHWADREAAIRAAVLPEVSR